MAYCVGTNQDFLLPNLAQNTESMIGAQSSFRNLFCFLQNVSQLYLHGERVGGKAENCLVRVGHVTSGQHEGDGQVQTYGDSLEEIQEGQQEKMEFVSGQLTPDFSPPGQCTGRLHPAA